MRQSFIVPAILNRIKRDLIHNPLHLILSADVLGMTKLILASLSKGFADLLTDGQFLQLRSKQVWSRRITGVSDVILQGTEALAQGVAFGLSGVLRKPVESARQYGVLGIAHGLGRAFLGFFVQPLSGALDFVSLTVDDIGASCSRCLEIIHNRVVLQRIRNPRVILAKGVIKEYCEREAIGQCSSLDKLDKKPCKIIWDVPWEELLSLELAKAGYQKPFHLILHLKNFKRSESFVPIIKCNVVEDEEQELQAIKICFFVQKQWKTYQSDTKIVTLKVPSSQRRVQFALDETNWKDSYNRARPMIKPRGFTLTISLSGEKKVIKHSVNFQKIWSSEQECRHRYALFPKQVVSDSTICSIWRPICPDRYVSVGDVAHVGVHSPHVVAIYRDSD